MSIRPLLLLVVWTLLAGCSPPRDQSQAPGATHAGLRLAAACLDIGVRGCTTDEGGYFNAEGRTLYWQIQSGETPDNLSGAAYAFAIMGPDGAWKPVAWGADGYFYEPPSLVWIDRTPYVAIAGAIRGTGRFNADALYRWSPDATRPLVKLDSEGWRSALARQLPSGFDVRKGVDFSYGDETVTARASLWRAEDGDCCPTGGEAHLSFAIEGDRLALRSVERLSPQA